MRRIILIVSIVVFVGFIFILLNTIRQKVRNDINTPLDVSQEIGPTVYPTVDVKKNPNEKKSLFIPYWTINSTRIAPEDYDTAIYFGVTTNETEVNKSDVGYINLSTFLKNTSTWQKHLLTLRMLDSKINFAILEDEKKQKSVITDFISIARENNFDGVVLDLEISALPFDSLISQINSFTKKMSSASHDANLSFTMMIYGDALYRVRPFDIKTLSSYSDQLYIMAYDFSKAKGNPGPNFPLSGKDTYGYDYATLIKNFLQGSSPKKLTVVFGMYGYDWTVDDNNVSITSIAEPLSMNKIEQKIISKCAYTSCTWERDPDAGEIKAEYKDSNNIKHIVWFEDTESVSRKMDFLKKHGITSFSFWAYSYF